MTILASSRGARLQSITSNQYLLSMRSLGLQPSIPIFLFCFVFYQQFPPFLSLPLSVFFNNGLGIIIFFFMYIIPISIYPRLLHLYAVCT